MIFSAKLAAPFPAQVEYLSPELARALEQKITLFTAPPGFLQTRQITAALSSRKIPTIWLRLENEDQDPGILLAALVAAIEKRQPGFGKTVLERMRMQPGPIHGWPPLFSQLLSEMRENLPSGTTFFLEHLQQLPVTGLSLELLGKHFLPKLPDGITCLLSSHTTLQPGILPAQVSVQTARNLRLDEEGAITLARMNHVDLEDRDVLRILALAEGRGEIVNSLLETCSLIESGLLARAISKASSINGVLAQIARSWITTASPNAIQQNLLALRTGYYRRETGQMTIPSAWLQPLVENWGRVQCSWHTTLGSIIPGRALDETFARDTANYLTSQNAVNQAISVFLDIGDTRQAAEVLAGEVQEMLDLGQWQTLKAWLNRIPEKELYHWPWLVYAQGEIQAAGQNGPAARQTFSTATELFRQKHDSEGVCQSLLTESAMAFWQGQKAMALNYAQNAQSEARSSRLHRYQAYAGWQLGCLYAAEGLYETALSHFMDVELLAASSLDAAMAELSRQGIALILNEMELKKQADEYQRALTSAEQSRQATLGSIQQIISTPASNLNSFLLEHGWSHTPLNLKSQPINPNTSKADNQKLAGLWQMLLGVFGLSHDVPDNQLPGPATPGYSTSEIPITGEIAAPPERITPPPASISAPMPEEILEEIGIHDNPQAEPVQVVSGLAKESEKGEPATGNTILAYLLGSFRVTIDDQPVSGWSGGRGRAVFQYLLTYHHRPRAREAIMDIFWQDATPESARNSLNVALHSLRGTLRSATDVPVVLFSDGAYRINPGFHLWLDVDEFEKNAQAAMEAEQKGDLDQAVERCEKAIQLYQDDFLANDLYEEWAVLPRERLRIVYMDTLDRLSRIYLKKEQYPACTQLSLRILERDRCREDAHCRLMRCYARQGEYQLAIRQYQACVEALQEDLTIEPSNSTLELFEKIRRREPV